MNLELGFGALLQGAGTAVLHFLWQGLVIGVLAAVAMRGCRREAAQARYCVALAGLGACAAVFAATFVMQLGPRAPVSGGSGTAVAVDGASVAWWTWLLRTESVSVVWCLGVGLLTVRLCVQLAAARRLGGGASRPPERWVEAFEGIKAQLGVHKAVRLLRHASIDTPMVVGWLAPAVLVPAGVFMSLTPDQLHAVLAHELAHLRRKDHLLNALQAVVEVVLFFHPVVWWISSRARIEREHCCDDVAVGAAASPLVFAEALARLESLRQVFPQAAVAANGGSLMERIERVLKVGSAPRAKSLRWGGGAAIVAGAVIVAAALAQASSQPGDAPAAPARPVMLRLVTPTVVTRPEVDDGQEATVELKPDEQLDENGNVVKHFRVVHVRAMTQEEYERSIKEGLKGATTKLDLAPISEEKDVLMVVECRLEPAVIEAMVESGEMTREEADGYLAALKDSAPLVHSQTVVKLRLDRVPGSEEAAARDAELQQLGRIRADVEAGTITQEEGDRMIEEMRKMAVERELRLKREAAQREAATKERRK